MLQEKKCENCLPGSNLDDDSQALPRSVWSDSDLIVLSDVPEIILTYFIYAGFVSLGYVIREFNLLGQ